VGEILSSKDKKIDPKDVTQELICAWHKKACVSEFNILNCDLNQMIKVLTQLLLERWKVNE
jgi:hypothetical protein